MHLTTKPSPDMKQGQAHWEPCDGEWAAKDRRKEQGRQNKKQHAHKVDQYMSVL